MLTANIKMKLKNYTIIIIFSINSIFKGFSQSNSDSLMTYKRLETKPSALFLFTAGYRMPLNTSKINNSGHGIYLEGGLNPGHLISKNHVIGLYAGYAFMDKSWSTSFNENFSNDYSSSIKKDSDFSKTDSSIINSSIELFKTKKGISDIMPGCQMNSFHNYSLYYGIIIKLPYKYLPTLKLYKGTMRSYYKGDGNILGNKSDYHIVELRRNMYGCELMIINLDQLLKRNKTKKHAVNNRGGGLSIYYENYNFYNSTLYYYDGITKTNLSLKNFTTSTFLKKYRNEFNAGFKLCFYIM